MERQDHLSNKHELKSIVGTTCISGTIEWNPSILLDDKGKGKRQGLNTSSKVLTRKTLPINKTNQNGIHCPLKWLSISL